MRPLSTGRLVLRDFVDADWPAVHLYARDPEVAKFMPWGPNTEEETRTFLRSAVEKQADPRSEYDVAVTLRDGGLLIGAIRLHVIRPAHKEGETGYVIRRDHWGRGYATEATRAILGFGFGELKLHRISATCDPDNGASARVLEKAGMRREGHLRENIFQKGKWRDSYLYAALAAEWTP